MYLKLQNIEITLKKNLSYESSSIALILANTGGWLYDRNTLKGCGVKWDKLLAANHLSILIKASLLFVVS